MNLILFEVANNPFKIAFIEYIYIYTHCQDRVKMETCEHYM